MFAILFFAWASYRTLEQKKIYKIVETYKRRWAWNIGKLVKKKQILLNSYFSWSFCFKKAKNNIKTKITSSSVLRLLEYKTVEENWIEESLAAFNVRIWL